STGSAARIVPFTSFPGIESTPSFSPDGNQVAFAWEGEKGDNVDIYVKQVGTEALLRLTTHPAIDYFPSWSPDCRYIAFIRSQAGVWCMSFMPSLGAAEGKIADLSLVASQLYGPAAPAWIPDGEWLVAPNRTSPQEPFAIFLVARQTGEKRRLTSPPPG